MTISAVGSGRSGIGGSLLWSRRWLNLSALALFLASASSLPRNLRAADEPAGCRAKGVLPELAAQHGGDLARILSAARATPNSETMLWRVERIGAPTSYLFGTVHVPHESLSVLDASVRAAIAKVRVVAMETVALPRAERMRVMASAGRLMSAGDQPLRRLLSDDELTLVEKSLEAAGYPAALALGIRPWVATLFLASSPCETQRLAAGAKPLDLLIEEEARRHALPVVGLETMLQQYEALAGIADEHQAAWLRASIETHDRIDDISETMVELYQARAIAAVWDLTRLMAPRAALTDVALTAIRRGLVGERNRRMLAAARPMLEAGGTFVAVGAQHLVGTDGIVAGLKALGYRVEPLE